LVGERKKESGLRLFDTKPRLVEYFLVQLKRAVVCKLNAAKYLS
jgi:hypothetical protein